MTSGYASVVCCWELLVRPEGLALGHRSGYISGVCRSGSIGYVRYHWRLLQLVWGYTAKGILERAQARLHLCYVTTLVSLAQR